MIEAGLSRSGIHRRAAAERLHRMHRGVYLVGHPVAPELAVEHAAVLACGDCAVLSHVSAAALWGLGPPRAGIVHVTVPGRRRRQRPGIRLHFTRELAPQDVRVREGIPVTAPARTLLDIASELELDRLRRAIDEAFVLRLATRAQLHAALQRAPHRPGVAAVRAILAAGEQPALTRSEAEARVLALIRKAGLPLPSVNARVGPYVVDFLWPAQRLVLEVDGYAYHRGRAAFERDRRRDADLAARGLTTTRVTWLQLEHEPEAFLVRLALALRAAG